MNIAEATQLADGTPIEEVTLTITSVGDKKLASPDNPSWGHEWFCQASDGTGRCGVIFKFKKPGVDPVTYAGKSINIKTSRNREGQLTGIKLKHKGQYRNIYITDSAKITVVGAGQAAPAATASQPRTSAPANQPSSGIPAMSSEEYAKHAATCWCQVYDWTAEIFKTRLKEEQIRECVTSVVITMQRDHIAILPITDRPINWKEYIFRDKKLGDYTPDQIKVGYALTLQGKFKNEDTIKAFRAAFDSLSIGHASVYGHLLLKEGIDDDTADSILLRSFKTPEEMTDDEFKTVISDAKFFEDAKALQASKKTPFDDDETSLD